MMMDDLGRASAVLTYESPSCALREGKLPVDLMQFSRDSTLLAKQRLRPSLTSFLSNSDALTFVALKSQPCANVFKEGVF